MKSDTRPPLVDHRLARRQAERDAGRHEAAIRREWRLLKGYRSYIKEAMATEAHGKHGIFKDNFRGFRGYLSRFRLKGTSENSNRCICRSGLARDVVDFHVPHSRASPLLQE
jgi:hypothetical protein